MKLSNRIWLTAFFAFGTIMWYESINGGSWQVSMLVAVLMTLLALNEVFGDARPFWIGLWAGLAALGRYDLCLVWPIYFLLVLHRRAPIRWAAALPICYGFALAATIYIWFNEARWGTLTDTGLWTYNPLNGNTPMAQHPTLFALGYFPGNFFTLFYMAPTLMERFPWIRPLPGGQSILTTSPAFLLALRAKFWRSSSSLGGTYISSLSTCTILIALMALVSAIPVLFYVGNGMSQFGARHFVMTYPFLLVLMAQEPLDQMGKVLIVVSVCLIGLGIYSIRMVGL